MNFGQKAGEQKLGLQLVPMIDVIFLLLIFFVTASVFAQLEGELPITVPSAPASEPGVRSPGEIIINVAQDGSIIVNQRALDVPALEDVLERIASLYPGQAVIIRADRKTYHMDVVAVLNACAAAKIWNISFATMMEEPSEGTSGGR